MLPSPGNFHVHTAIDKALHKRKRKVIGQGLSDHNMRSFEPAMLGQIDIFLHQIAKSSTQGEEEWSDSIDMTLSTRYLGFDIMSTFSFGQTFGLQTKPDNRFVLETVDATSIRHGAYQQYPGIARFKIEKLLYPHGAMMFEKYRELMANVVAARLQRNMNDQNDLFSFIINAKDPATGKGLDEKEIWAEARFLIVAGEKLST